MPTLSEATSTASPAFDWTPNIHVKVDADGVLTVTAFRSEMGQGIRTALAMLVAEELDVAWEQVRIDQALADPRYGDQVTGGSVSISTYYDAMRLAGATADIIEAAAGLGVKSLPTGQAA
jgi:CO/xanthine dehydrogenase Mo-binding subunit